MKEHGQGVRFALVGDVLIELVTSRLSVMAGDAGTQRTREQLLAALAWVRDGSIANTRLNAERLHEVLDLAESRKRSA